MRDYLKFYRLSDVTFYDCVNTIYQFLKPYLDNKMSTSEEYRAVNTQSRVWSCFIIVMVCFGSNPYIPSQAF